jgi:hypothetical protein
LRDRDTALNTISTTENIPEEVINQKRLLWVWVIPLLLLTFALTARLLDANAIWVDEYWTYRTGDGAYFGPATPYSVVESIIIEDPWTVPAYFFLINIWAALVGWSPFAIRALSLLVGMLATAWTYRLGRAVGGHWVGLGAALALGASAFFIHYIGEMRNYAMLPVMSAFVVWAYWRISRRAKPSRLLQAAFVLCAAAMPYMHYFAALPLVGIGVYHLTLLLQKGAAAERPYKTVKWWRPLLLLAMSALLFVPWAYLVTLPVLRRVASQGHESPYLNWLDAPATVLAFANGSVALVVIVGWYLLVHGFVAKGRRAMPLQSLRGVWFAVTTTLAAILVAFLINQWRPILLYYRYLIAVFPLLALCAGLGMARMIKSGVHPILVYGVWLITGLFAVFNPTFMDAYQNPLINAQPWHRLVAVLQHESQPNDDALFHMPDNVWYVWQQFSADFYLHGVPLRYQIIDSFADVPDENYYARVDAFMRDSTAPRLWVVYPTAQRPDALHVTERALADQQYAACDMPTETAGYRLSLYTRADRAPDVWFTEEPVSTSYDGSGVGLRLVMPLPAEANDTLDVVLGIAMGADVPAETYSFSLRVVDADGTLVTQFDDGLPYPPSFTCRTIRISGLTTGAYTLNAVVYAWQTGERLTGQGGDELTLGTFRVR